jgi:fumarate reductase flavoprotein subunit
MAYLAGAELIDLEMIQFVPLPSNPRFLYLRYFPDFWKGPYQNRLGEIFESDADRYQGESYAFLFVQKLFREMEKGNGPVSIDQRDLGPPAPAGLVKSWDQRRRLMKTLGMDPHENKIDLVIGSHFGMGGIRVNTRTETTVPGLFAAGEVMGGVHGGMRLSGYSFTQMIVFGFEAGKQAAGYALERGKTEEVSLAEVEVEKDRIFQFLRPKKTSLTVHELKQRLQKLMGEHVFVMRDGAGLMEAVRQIPAFREDLSHLAVPDFKIFNLEWGRAIELSLMVEVAEIIARSALAREESRGAHYRRDFREEDNRNSLRHTVARLKGGHLTMNSTPVALDRMRPA